MTNSIGIYNHSTGEEIIREMTPEEKANRDAEIAVFVAQQKQLKAEAKKLYETKVSAYQKLGLSEAEIEALVPTPVEPSSLEQSV